MNYDIPIKIQADFMCFAEVPHRGHIRMNSLPQIIKQGNFLNDRIPERFGKVDA